MCVFFLTPCVIRKPQLLPTVYMAKPLQIATVNGFYSFYHAFSVVDIAFANGQFSQRTAFDSTELMIDVD